MSEQAADDLVKVDVHEEPAWRRVIDVEVNAEAVTAAYTQVYKNLQKQAKIPGFRPGKAPLEMIQQRYGDRVDEDVLDILIPGTLTRVYRDHNLFPITNPKLSNLHLKPGEPLRYRAAIEVRPEITPQGYDNLVLQKQKMAVVDQHVDETIERIRERRADFQPTTEPAARGDLVVCDLTETSQLEAGRKPHTVTDVTVELNPERTFPEIADGLLGVKAGDERKVSLTYPEEHGDTTLAGRRVEYGVNVKEVKAKRLPELDLEFLKSLAGGIDSLDDLKARVREDLEAQNEAEALRVLQNELITELLARNEFELPESLVTDYLNRLESDLKNRQPDITREQVEEQYKAMGMRQVSWEFLYHAIAKKEELTVTDDDVEAWLAVFAERQGVPIDQARSELSGADRVRRVKDNLLEKKVLDFLLAGATVTELPIKTNLIQPPGAGREANRP